MARDIPLPADTVFAAMVSLSAQSRWVVATRVRPAPDGPAPRSGAATAGGSSAGVAPPGAPPRNPPAPPHPGSRIVARTGVGPVGFDDVMLVVCYQPPRRWRVRHTGSLVRGWGEWGVLPRAGTSRVYLAEEFELPWGAAGRIGWLLLGWLVRAGVRMSLRRLDRGLRSGTLAGAT